MDISIMDIKLITLDTGVDIINITPDEGKVLTNGNTYSENIYLGVNDSVENWNEILKEEVPKEENNPEIF
jgi:hypothetical protein